MSAPANDRPRLAPSARADANDYTFIFGAIRTLGDLRRRLPVVFARSGSARSTPDPPRPIPTEPLTGFEPVTSALPRMRSTTELQRPGFPIHALGAHADRRSLVPSGGQSYQPRPANQP